MARAAVVPLARNAWRIPLVGDFINGFMLRDDDGQVTLIDFGVKKSGPRVLAALSAIGSGPSDVTRLMLTHCHPDHVGGAAHLARETGRDVDCHEDDAPFAGKGTVPKSDEGSRIGRLFNKLPPPKLEALPIGETFTDGQVIPFAGGIRVVHTPGHSPGHASYLLEDAGVLITGDAIFNVRGLRYSPRILCANYAMTQETAHRLAELDYSAAAFTHGPEISDRPREAIRAFLAQR